jgi:hypothetical protein
MSRESRRRALQHHPVNGAHETQAQHGAVGSRHRRDDLRHHATPARVIGRFLQQGRVEGRAEGAAKAGLLGQALGDGALV